ncbi:Hypothetical predicted protein [Drosophila guanche]|uniref:Uncharacterized protein n=1 Tax=Drosophila guanche TaxID=7266 RepID=A0A3B0K3R6_DROGU|nr:Hypothetical predicted protein [Drosophila guanche]
MSAVSKGVGTADIYILTAWPCTYLTIDFSFFSIRLQSNTHKKTQHSVHISPISSAMGVALMSKRMMLWLPLLALMVLNSVDAYSSTYT